MNYFEISEKELQELYHTEIDVLELSVRTHSGIRRYGCASLGELVYMSVEEVQKALKDSSQRMEEVQEKLAARNLSLMTQDEKQRILSETDNPNVLRRQIIRLETIEKSNQETIEDYRSQIDAKWERIREDCHQALMAAREIVRTHPYPIARIVSAMYFQKDERGSCGFCQIFELQKKNCFVETDSMERRDMTHSCEECIDAFLSDYYWTNRMSAKLAEERNETPKMMRMRLVGRDLYGRCPGCTQRYKYNNYDNYCFRCGTALNWDKENWDEDTQYCLRHFDYFDDDELLDDELGIEEDELE